MLTCYPFIQAILFVFLMSQSSLAHKEQLAPILSYTAPHYQIHLSADFQLTIIEEVAVYDNPVSSIPSHINRVERREQVSPKEVAALLHFIQESGFYDLKASYGAEAAIRSYPYSILVHDGVQEKAVIYHSRPDGGERPAAFMQVENKIRSFVQAAVESNPGGLP